MTSKNVRSLGRVLLVTALMGAGTGAVSCAGIHGVPWSMKSWNGPVQPFTVAGNIHYVGTNFMAIFLVTTPDGHILLDSGFEANVPQLRRNVEALGFRFSDIKILLASHAHIDHVQGHALVRQLTGARVLASAADAPVIASGGKGEWAYGDSFAWAPCPVDGLIADGQQVSLGGTTLTARLTPGHTKGATTWTTTVADGERRPLDVVFYASGTIPPGARLVDNPEYPQAVTEFQRSFVIWKALPCDIFLGPHGSFFDLTTKRDKMKEQERQRSQSAGNAAAPNPFIDPVGYQRAMAAAEQKFLAAVANQR